jgi:hypothetical protein
MPDIARLLEEIAAAKSADELAAIATEIEENDLSEQSLEQIADAFREAHERLNKAP